MSYLIYAILILVLVILVRKILSRYKFPKISAIAVFTGAVKVGKSGVSLACALSRYRSLHRSWRINCFFRKLFKKPLKEEPLLYSNIPLAGVPYYDLTVDHILRKVRFNFSCVTFVDEASFLADCYLSKIKGDLDVNVNAELELLEFCKLYGHETHGGYLIVNTQSMSDLNIALRKCTNQMFYLHSASSLFLLPISICKMREERYSEDGTVINSYNEDVEDSMKTVLFRKRTFDMYDRFCFSVLTDDLPVKNIRHYNKIGSSLKVTSLPSFRRSFVEMFEKLNREKELKK